MTGTITTVCQAPPSLLLTQQQPHELTNYGKEPSDETWDSNAPEPPPVPKDVKLELLSVGIKPKPMLMLTAALKVKSMPNVKFVAKAILTYGGELT